MQCHVRSSALIRGVFGSALGALLRGCRPSSALCGSGTPTQRSADSGAPSAAASLPAEAYPQRGQLAASCLNDDIIMKEGLSGLRRLHNVLAASQGCPRSCSTTRNRRRPRTCPYSHTYWLKLFGRCSALLFRPAVSRLLATLPSSRQFASMVTLATRLITGPLR